MADPLAASNANLNAMLATNAVPGETPDPPRMPLVFENPADGAVVRIDRDRIAARSQNGDTIKFFRGPMNYEFQNADATIGDFSDGTIAAARDGAVVLVRPGGEIARVAADGSTGSLGAWKSDDAARRALVDGGYLDAASFEDLAALRANGRDLATIPAVRADFNPATDRIFQIYQQADIARRWKPTRGSNA